ncbi:hypothetical protein Ocin01_07922 [Orchesella cincta]|uniref:Uncharacterized protein n=1 Tax=Orchesella cincta TaxID=48709 RepID=A0A1D2N1H7_ORCCI|nr:hypothetical protein Ocin01_07922 [Orchesella cincta]
MGNNKQHQATKGGRVKKQSSTVLSIKRKKMIMKFKSTWITGHLEDTKEVLETKMRTQGWKEMLFENLSVEDANIRYNDVDRWIKKHHWITVPDAVPTGFTINDVQNSGVTVYSNFHSGSQQPEQHYRRNMPLLQRKPPVPPTSYSDLVAEENDEDNDDEDNDQSFHTPSAYAANTFVETADEDHNENVASVFDSSDDEEEHAIDLRIDHANNPLSTPVSRKREILDRFLGITSNQIEVDDNNASTSSAYVNPTAVNTQQDDFRFSQPDEITSARAPMGNASQGTFQEDLTTENNTEELQRVFFSQDDNYSQCQQTDQIPGTSASAYGEVRPPMGNTSHDTFQQGVTTGSNTEGEQRVYFSHDHNYSQYQQPGQMPRPPVLAPMPSLRITPRVHFEGLIRPRPKLVRAPTPSRQGPRIPHGMKNQRNPAPSSAPNSDMTNTSSSQPPYGQQDGRGIDEPSTLPPFNETFRPTSLFHTATHGIWLNPLNRVSRRQPPLYNEVLNRRYLQAQRLRQQAPGFTMSSEQTGSGPPGFCPGGLEQNTTNYQGQAFAGLRFKVIRTIVDFSDPKFKVHLIPSEKAAKATLVVEAMTAVCKKIPALRPAVDYLQSLIGPMRRAWKNELLPLKYNNAQSTIISDMKHETTQGAVANTTTSNSVQVEGTGGGQQ